MTKAEMQTAATEEKDDSQATSPVLVSEPNIIEDSEDIDFVVENVRTRVSMPVVRTSIEHRVTLSHMLVSKLTSECLVGPHHHNHSLVDLSLFPRQYHRSRYPACGHQNTR